MNLSFPVLVDSSDPQCDLPFTSRVNMLYMYIQTCFASFVVTSVLLLPSSQLEAVRSFCFDFWHQQVIFPPPFRSFSVNLCGKIPAKFPKYSDQQMTDGTFLFKQPGSCVIFVSDMSHVIIPRSKRSLVNKLLDRQRALNIT